MNLTLPRDEDKIMSGYFGLVAIWVTQPLWPLRVPLSFKVSDILNDQLSSVSARTALTGPDQRENEKNVSDVRHYIWFQKEWMKRKERNIKWTKIFSMIIDLDIWLFSIISYMPVKILSK